MECSCVRYTELPHTSKLFADLLYHRDRVAAFYPTASYQEAAAQVSFPTERRAALVSALRVQNPGSAALDLLARDGTVAVVTGQQVGLFSGPAYTVYKALTAVKLARQLSDAGIAAVPIFWLATEDHDLAEVNHVWSFDAAHQPLRLELPRNVSGQPVGQIELSAPPVQALRQSLAGFPNGEEVAALVEQCYTPGKTLGGAFSDLLHSLLSQYDLIRVDPMSPALRELAAPAIRAALESAPELTRLLLERNKELLAGGYHAQVHIEDQTSLVFLLENGRRHALRRHEREYVLNGRRFLTEELMERADQLSPNALLRPVVQDFILPTAAYIGGPAELAYLAQAEVLYRHIVGRMPAVLHRTGFTLLDQRSRKLMARYGLSLTDFFHGEQVLRERMAVKLIPPELARGLEETRETVQGTVDSLTAQLTDFDVTLAAALAKSRKKIAHQISKIERKVGREIMRREHRAAQDAAYLNGLIYPNRHLQERLYSILPFLARHGLGLIGHLYEQVRLECPDHQLLVV